MTNIAITAEAPQPGVSVIVPFFNREALIPFAIRSLQAEAGIDLEVLAVDDGSTDGTAALVASMSEADSRIRLLSQDHRGVAAARNMGLRHASREFVTFLDSDDLCAPGRLARQIAKFRSFPKPDVVIGHRIYFRRETGSGFPGPAQVTRRNVDICLASAMFPRELFARFGFFDEKLTFGEDLDFYWRLLESGCLFLIETDAAVYHRRHEGNMTNDALAMHRALLRVHHNSWVRRRAEGREGRLEVFFFRNFETETLWDGKQGVQHPEAPKEPTVLRTETPVPLAKRTGRPPAPDRRPSLEPSRIAGHISGLADMDTP